MMVATVELMAHKNFKSEDFPPLPSKNTLRACRFPSMPGTPLCWLNPAPVITKAIEQERRKRESLMRSRLLHMRYEDYTVCPENTVEIMEDSLRKMVDELHTEFTRHSGQDV